MTAHRAEMPEVRSGGVADPQQALPRPAPTPPRPVTDDTGDLYTGGFSLAAALGATLLGVAGEQMTSR